MSGGVEQISNCFLSAGFAHFQSSALLVQATNGALGLLQCDTLSPQQLSAQWHVKRFDSDPHLSTNQLNPFEVSVSTDACKSCPMDMCVCADQSDLQLRVKCVYFGIQK